MFGEKVKYAAIKLISTFQKRYFSNCAKVGQKINTDYEYHHQYMGVEQDGNRWVYINAFPLIGDFEERLKTLEIAHNDFAYACNLDVIVPGWGIFFNIDTEEFSGLQISN